MRHLSRRVFGILCSVLMVSCSALGSQGGHPAWTTLRQVCPPEVPSHQTCSEETGSSDGRFQRARPKEDCPEEAGSKEARSGSADQQDTRVMAEQLITE